MCLYVWTHTLYRWGFTINLRFLTCVFGSVPQWWMTWLSESRLQDAGCPVLLSRSMVARPITEGNLVGLVKHTIYSISIMSNVRFRAMRMSKPLIGKKWPQQGQRFLYHSTGPRCKKPNWNECIGLFICWEIRQGFACRCLVKGRRVCLWQSNSRLVMAWLGQMLSLSR